jgi:cytochrome b subunit of formate dehydrogenase
MNIHFRIAHWLTMGGFAVLAATGFALKFPEAWWAAPLLRWEGRHAVRGTVHRGAAIVLLLGLAYHIAHMVASRRDRKALRYLMPVWQDARDLAAMFRHNLGGRAPRPTFGVFSYHEKIEYWAYLWGTIVMAASGFVLWFNDVSLAWLPKWISDAATSLHYYEAILAAGAILVWHLYMVLFDPDVYPMETHWITGRVPAEHLRRTRPSYYARLTTQETEEPPESAPGAEAGGGA